MRNILPVIILFLSFSSCNSDNSIGSEKSVVEIKAADKISSIVRNPVTADKVKDTINVAKIMLEEKFYDFGEVDEGDKIEHTFRFKNEGKVNLLISNAKSTCGCTVPKWPKHPISPNEFGEINVVFDTKGKKNKQSKPIKIIANTYPQETTIYMKGFVEPKEGKK